MGLKKLYLPTMAEGYVEVSKLSEKSKQTYEQYLATLVELELNGKHLLAHTLRHDEQSVI